MSSGNRLDNFLLGASIPLKKTIACLQFCMPNGPLNESNPFSYFLKVTGNASPNNSVYGGGERNLNHLNKCIKHIPSNLLECSNPKHILVFLEGDLEICYSFSQF